MEKELPYSWAETELGNILKLKNGFAFKSEDFKDTGIPVIRISNIQNEQVETEDAARVDLSKIKQEFVVQKGDILIAMSGATTGKYGIYNENIVAVQNQRVGNLVPHDDNLTSRRFIYYLLGGLKKEIEDKAYGGAQPNISPKIIEEIIIGLPPLPEQQRIVAKLDSLFGHLDALKTRLDRIPQLLKDFRQKVLTQAVTGKLTEEWREGRELESEYDPDFLANMRDTTIEIPELWYWLPFESIATIKSNLVDPNEYLEYPLIAPDNIQSETGLLINKPLVSDIMPISSKHIFEKGSIVYSKIRPYLSKLVIVDFDGLCSADMYPIISDLETRYLFYYMLSEHFLSYATTAGERTVLPKINQKGLNEIPVPVPPREEQQEIVHRVESLFAKVDRIEASYQKLKAKIEQLPQALLTKAFRGELVDQLPTDGNARDLLEQIKQAKEGLEKGGKSKWKKQ